MLILSTVTVAALALAALGICGRFVEQKLMLSSNFKCDQIDKNDRNHFGRTLLYYLSLT